MILSITLPSCRRTENQGVKNEGIIVECFEENGYMIIDVFFSVLSGMNYPVLAHDDTMLKFIDVDEKFKKTEIRYDFRTRKIIMG